MWENWYDIGIYKVSVDSFGDVLCVSCRRKTDEVDVVPNEMGRYSLRGLFWLSVVVSYTNSEPLLING